MPRVIMTKTNPIKPADRKRIAQAASNSVGNWDEGLTLVPSIHDDRPFMIETKGDISSHLCAAIRELDCRIVGITNRSDKTQIHIERRP